MPEESGQLAAALKMLGAQIDSIAACLRMRSTFSPVNEEIAT
jgi:hypothetical protein